MLAPAGVVAPDRGELIAVPAVALDRADSTSFRDITFLAAGPGSLALAFGSQRLLGDGGSNVALGRKSRPDWNGNGRLGERAGYRGSLPGLVRPEGSGVLSWGCPRRGR